MHAAVVRSFDQSPQYDELPAPAPRDEDEVLVDVLAAGLHPRVRSQADGSHYTSTDELPLVPGIDGVGRFPDGTIRYFVLPDTAMGSLAEQTVVDIRRSVVLPGGTDPLLVAAAMNPAMASWVALRRRIEFQPGQSVLVLGATGNAGQLAIQVAKRLGAGRVIAAGRDQQRLAGLVAIGADEVVALEDETASPLLSAAAAEVDVVLDFLWGQPATDALVALARHRRDASRPVTWVEIGSVAGPTAAIPSAALRAIRLQIVGSGQGSVATRQIVAELGDLAQEITTGTFDIAVQAVPLSEVRAAWDVRADSGQRVVLEP